MLSSFFGHVDVGVHCSLRILGGFAGGELVVVVCRFGYRRLFLLLFPFVVGTVELPEPHSHETIVTLVLTASVLAHVRTRLLPYPLKRR